MEWWHRIFFGLIDMVVSADVLYIYECVLLREYSTEKLKMLHFRRVRSRPPNTKTKKRTPVATFSKPA